MESLNNQTITKQNAESKLKTMKQLGFLTLGGSMDMRDDNISNKNKFIGIEEISHILFLCS